MTCIDAAIIKALVEHIGGNPDDVEVDVDKNIFYDIYKPINTIEWIPNNPSVFITASKVGSAPKIGDIIVLEMPDGTLSSFVCYSFGTQKKSIYFDETITEYMFRGFHDNSFAMVEYTSEGHWRIITTFNPDFIPDNTTSGIFRRASNPSTSPFSVESILTGLFSHMVDIVKQLDDRTKALESANA